MHTLTLCHRYQREQVFLVCDRNTRETGRMSRMITVNDMNHLSLNMVRGGTHVHGTSRAPTPTCTTHNYAHRRLCLKPLVLMCGMGGIAGASASCRSGSCPAVPCLPIHFLTAACAVCLRPRLTPGSWRC